MDLIRKEYTIQPHRIIGQIIEILKFAGMWGTDSRPVFIDVLTKVFHFSLSTLFFVALIVASLSSANRNESLYLAAVAVSAAVHSVKLVYVLGKKDQLLTFLKNVCYHSVRDSKHFGMVEQRINSFAKFGFIFLVLVTVGILGFYILTLPIFSSDTDDVNLPLRVAFPLDWKNNRINYWIAHLFVIGAISTDAIVISFSVVCWYTLFNCSLKYKILGNQLRALGRWTDDTVVSNLSPNEREELFSQNFAELVTAHRNIRE